VQVLCNGGSTGAITLGVTGGVYPYTYVWPQAPAINDSLAINLAANTYTANITDANGCTTSVTTVIHQPAALTATILTDSVLASMVAMARYLYTQRVGCRTGISSMARNLSKVWIVLSPSAQAHILRHYGYKRMYIYQ
jgi:hypothetical protein